MKVLVIDDEPQIIKFLCIALQSEGYDVLQAITGKEGLEQIALQNPNLVVLDLGLPDMDGRLPFVIQIKTIYRSTVFKKANIHSHVPVLRRPA